MLECKNKTQITVSVHFMLYHVIKKKVEEVPDQIWSSKLTFESFSTLSNNKDIYLRPADDFWRKEKTVDEWQVSIFFQVFFLKLKWSVGGQIQRKKSKNSDGR